MYIVSRESVRLTQPCSSTCFTVSLTGKAAKDAPNSAAESIQLCNNRWLAKGRTPSWTKITSTCGSMKLSAFFTESWRCSPPGMICAIFSKRIMRADSIIKMRDGFRWQDRINEVNFGALFKNTNGMRDYCFYPQEQETA